MRMECNRQRVIARILPHTEILTGLGVPQANSSVFTDAGEQAAIRMVGDGPDSPGVSLHHAQAMAAAGIPHAHGLIVATADKQFSIGGEFDGAYSRVVTLQQHDTVST